MKKFFVILVATIAILPAFASPAMEEMLKGWENQPIDNVLKQWGSASKVKGNVYTWEEKTVESTPNTTFSSVYDPSHYNASQTNMWFGEFKSGSFARVRFCKRILTTDENNMVIKTQYEGNSCPATKLGTKKWAKEN